MQINPPRADWRSDSCRHFHFDSPLGIDAQFPHTLNERSLQTQKFPNIRFVVFFGPHPVEGHRIPVELESGQCVAAGIAQKVWPGFFVSG